MKPYVTTVEKFFKYRNASDGSTVGDSIWGRPLNTFCPINLEELNPEKLDPTDNPEDILQKEVVLVCKDPSKKKNERYYSLYAAEAFCALIAFQIQDNSLPDPVLSASELSDPEKVIRTYTRAQMSSVKLPAAIINPETNIELARKDGYGMVKAKQRTTAPTAFQKLNLMALRGVLWH